ncbi:preprotein translocase subunit SecY [Pasteuria penetrans]|uniref:preprotein translocase subunit SecY n=1 Tax=Pasteuria penetrans TaxID=86005 RepID=UPI000F99EDFE|nr:preprotein translocase subunit SecY [Pasteuria penetrans]
MIDSLRNIYRIRDLRDRILFTLLMIVVFRIGAHIPVPYLDLATVAKQVNSGGIFDFLNAFSGGALGRSSVFTLTVAPYITASIVVQMLSMDVVPAFTRWMKEGESGRRKMNKVTRYLTAGFAVIQGYTALSALRMSAGGASLLKETGFWPYLLVMVTLVVGTIFLMWIGEQISEHGISNGISILIFAGIVASLPGLVSQMKDAFFSEEQREAVLVGGLKAGLIALILLLVVVSVIYIQEGVRRIPVQYTKRVVGRRMYGGRSTHIPLKVNTAGVVPVILAVALFFIPQTIVKVLGGERSPFWSSVLRMTNPHDLGFGMLISVLLITLFTFFYAYMTLNPPQLAEQMKKNGGFIPGVRPGKATEQYVSRILTRLTMSGALFLSAIFILPSISAFALGLPPGVGLSGTSLLIVVGVALEVMKTVQNQLVRRNYRGFL